MKRLLLLGAGGSAAANFLDAVRLSDDDWYVLGADASPARLHLSGVDEAVIVPRAAEPGYADALVRACEKWRIDVVHAQPDPDVKALGAIRDRVGAAHLLPAQEVLELAADKAACAAVLAAADVAVPETAGVADGDGIADVTANLLERHAKVWVRARTGAGSRASLPVRTVDQARAWVQWWVDERGLREEDFAAAQFLPGREFAYQSVWFEGALLAGQARERVEYLYGHLTPSGQTSTPAIARTVTEPTVDATAQAAVRAIDPEPHGVFCVDLKESAVGEPMVTEINAGRFFTTSNFFAHAGLNMPAIALACALGDPPAPQLASSPLPPDLYWIRMVDMGYRLVHGDELDAWPRADR